MINRRWLFVWIIDFRPFNDNRFEDKRQSLNGFIVEGKVEKSKSVFLSPEYWKSKKKTVDSRDIYDSLEDYDSLERQWTIIQREIEIEIEKQSFQERRLLRIVNWFWMESWKLKIENWKIHLTNNQIILGICRQTVRIHETLKKLAYSRVYPYTHALFF